MKIKLGFSSCPNDTYIFDALVHGKIDLKGYSFEPVIADIEELNHLAITRQLDMVKVSIGALPNLINNYRVLDSGAALGNGVGPLVVACDPNIDLKQSDITIAIPGEKTTANRLLSIFYPNQIQKKTMLFSDIEDAVLSGTVDAGVLIHEGRFTYQEKGLRLICDLGFAWEQKTGLPLPLGCICASRDLPESVVNDLQDILRNSLRFANQFPDSSKAFIADNAQEMKPEVIQSHIALYVNSYSVSLGELGRKSIFHLMEMMKEKSAESLEPKTIFTNFAS